MKFTYNIKLIMGQWYLVRSGTVVELCGDRVKAEKKLLEATGGI